MKFSKLRTLLVSVPIALPSVVGCSGQNLEDDELGNAEQAALGDQIPGISAPDFAAAKATFNAVEELDEGLGPIFNEAGCGVCHNNGAIGGAGDQIERRFGRFVNGRFDPLANLGGSLRQLFTVGRFTGLNGQACNVPLEVEPSAATVRNVGRLTTPLFGLGLVDAMPDSFFDGLAAAQPAAIRGTVNRVPILVPNPDDASQAIGTIRVGRFGWKAGVPNLVQFAADAYVNEMGITTQSCFRGTSILAFATESAPNGVPQPAGCDDLAPPPPAGVPAGTDDAVGSCAGGRTEIQDDVVEFAEFMTFLRPPPRGNISAAVNRGEPAVRAGRLRRLPPFSDVQDARLAAERCAGEFHLPPVLGFPGARHGRARRPDRQCRRLGSRHAPDANRAAVGHPLPSLPAPRRSHRGHRHCDPGSRRSRRCRTQRVQRPDRRTAERSDRVRAIALSRPDTPARAQSARAGDWLAGVRAPHRALSAART